LRFSVKKSAQSASPILERAAILDNQGLTESWNMDFPKNCALPPSEMSAPTVHLFWNTVLSLAKGK
jgi:hypothetical protein